MKLWLVSSKSGVPYDSYDSFVVRAKTEDDALRIANAHGWGDLGSVSRSDVEIKPVSSGGPEEVVHGSFKAG